MIKRELYVKNNIKYNEEIFLLEDVEVMGKLGYFAKKIGKVNTAYYYYRIGENNGTFNNLPLKHLNDSLKCFKNLEEFYSNDIEIKKLIIRKKNLRMIGMFLGGRFSSLEGYEDILKNYLKDIRSENFILKKYIDTQKDETCIKILLFNLLKLFKIEEKKIKKMSIFILKIKGAI